MNKYRLGWPDLLLLVAIVPAVTGHFYALMALLGLYALLYFRATHRGSPTMSGEQLAQLWHDEHCGVGVRSVPWCWCCCTECDPDWSGTNPYFAIAQQEMREPRQPMRELPRDFVR